MILNIPFVTGICFWQNIVKMDFNNFNIGMLNNEELKECEEFDMILRNSYPYSSSNFVNDIIFKIR